LDPKASRSLLSRFGLIESELTPKLWASHGLLIETPSWPDLDTFHTCLLIHSARWCTDYTLVWPVLPPETEWEAMSLAIFGTPHPPQLAYSCDKPLCRAYIVIDRHQDGSYTLQTARSNDKHDHRDRLPSPVPANPAITPAVAPAPIVPVTPILSHTEPSPRPVSKKRKIEEPISSTSSKRSTAQVSPTSGTIAGSDRGEHRVASPVDGSDDSAIVENPNTHSPSRNSVRDVSTGFRSIRSDVTKPSLYRCDKVPLPLVFLPTNPLPFLLALLLRFRLSPNTFPLSTLLGLTTFQSISKRSFDEASPPLLNSDSGLKPRLVSSSSCKLYRRRTRQALERKEGDVEKRRWMRESSEGRSSKSFSWVIANGED